MTRLLHMYKYVLLYRSLSSASRLGLGVFLSVGLLCNMGFCRETSFLNDYRQSWIAITRLCDKTPVPTNLPVLKTPAEPMEVVFGHAEPVSSQMELASKPEMRSEMPKDLILNPVTTASVFAQDVALADVPESVPEIGKDANVGAFVPPRLTNDPVAVVRPQAITITIQERNAIQSVAYTSSPNVPCRANAIVASVTQNPNPTTIVPTAATFCVSRTVPSSESSTSSLSKSNILALFAEPECVELPEFTEFTEETPAISPMQTSSTLPSIVDELELPELSIEMD